MLPFIPALGEPSFVADLDDDAQADCAALEEFLSWIEQQGSLRERKLKRPRRMQRAKVKSRRPRLRSSVRGVTR